MFAVPSLVSLYLLASSPSYLGGTQAKTPLQLDTERVAGIFFDYFSNWNPDYEGARSAYEVKETRRSTVLVTGRQ